MCRRYSWHKEIRKKAYCHCVNNFINDLNVLSFKISTILNNAMEILDNCVLFIYIIKWSITVYATM